MMKTSSNRGFSVTLLVPTLNEIDGMRAIMPRVLPGWVDQIMILDGGSTDGTIEYAREQGYFVHVQARAGHPPGLHGSAAFHHGGRGAHLQPRRQFDPRAHSRDLVDKIAEGYDMVIASRYLGRAKSEDDDFLTSFGNWLFTRTVNFCSAPITPT